ncbi:MAG: PIG-L family deacetylase [Clostridia bacterium]|nr:PIG-L family deacetylase [Clostridia bacterium]
MTGSKGPIRRLAAALCLCLCLILGAIPAGAEQAAATAQDITKKCQFKVTEGYRGRMTDDDVRTYWEYKKTGAYVAVKLPEGAQAGWVRIEWLFDPTGFDLIEYDAGLNALRQRNQDDTFPNIYTLFDLLPETRYIQLKMTAKNQKVCTVKVYSKGELPRSVQAWNPPVLKADVMLVSTHQDDELIFMGGTIPYYATALKKPTVVVYMANCTRYRRMEALNSLWKMGVRDYPEFINLQDSRVDSLKKAVALWGGKEAVLSVLVERIRRFKPEVIVTHDLNGEYGHNQHKVTARAMSYAIEAAADPTRFPESFEIYGAWQVKKLYLHLYDKNQIMMDWETKLDSLAGYSPLKVAQIGMKEQASQLKYYSVKSHGKYDNAKFGLYMTTVGEDVAKNDFLENIDPDASANYLAEHPEAAELVEKGRRIARGEPAEPEEEADNTPVADGTAEDDDEALADDPEPEPTEVPPEATPAEAPAAEVEAEPAEAAAGEATLAPTAAPEAAQPPEAAAPRAEARESDGGSALAVAAIALGVAGLGAGGWYAWRTLGGRRRRRHRHRRR